MNIRHDAVPVPAGTCPFEDSRLSLFRQGLEMLLESGDLPQGYGVTVAEMRGQEFDEWEDLRIGLQKKSSPIQISCPIWKPRTELWAQGLFVMNSILN